MKSTFKQPYTVIDIFTLCSFIFHESDIIFRVISIALLFVIAKKVKSIQRSGIEAIRTQLQPSKHKREITNITNSQIQREHMVNRVSSYFPKDGSLSNRNRTKNDMNTCKVKHH